MIDCAAFGLPAPEKLVHVVQKRPGSLTCLLESNDPHSNGMLRIWMEEKDQNWNGGRPDLREMFAFDMFSPDMDEEDGEEVTVETQTLDGHAAYTAFSLPDEHLPFLKFTSLIDLDETYCLVFNYYGTHYEEERASRLEEVKKMLKSLHIGGNFAETAHLAEEERDREAEERIRQHQKNYTSAEEQAKDPFHARHYPEIFAEFEEKVKKHEVLSQYADGIYSNARLAIGLLPIEEDDYAQKGNTRFGGLPDLPPGVAWPSIYTGEPGDYRVDEKAGKLCEFIAQVNFSDMRGMCGYLPERGILYFFIDGHFEERAHLFYYDGDPKDLTAAKDLGIDPERDVYTFASLRDDYAAYDEEGLEYYEQKPPKPAKVRVFPHVSILNSMDEEDEICEYPPAIRKNLAIDREMNPYDAVDDFNDQLAGYTDATLHAINANVYANHFSPYVYASDHSEDEEAAEDPRPQDYVVLLRVAPDERISNFDHRADSPIHFVIHKEKLRKLDFSAIYYGYLET